MKQKTKMRLIVLGVIVIAAAVFVSGVFNPNRYVLVYNASEEDIYRVRMDYSFRGTVFPDIDGGISIGRRSGIPGDNAYYPITVGERHTLEMHPRKGVEIGKTATITLAVDDVRIKTADSIGWGLEIPIRRGCCTKLFITGSKEAGYVLEVGGFTNWLIH